MHKALIAAGGRATRLRPITHTLNKHLIPLANKPMIFYGVETLVKAGVQELLVNVNPGEQELQKVMGDGSRWGITVKYVEQEGGPLGLAHIVRNAEKYLAGEPFIFYLGDNVILDSIEHLVEKFKKEQLDMCLAFAHIPNPQQFGVAEIQDGKLVRIIEKPQNPPSDLAQTGIYLYSQKIFEAVKAIKPSARGEYEISDANTYMIEKGYNVGWVEVPGWWKDNGKPEDLLEGNQFIMSHFKFEDNRNGAKVGKGVVIQGRVQIGKDTELEENVLIRGPVIIGNNCKIQHSQS